MVWGAELGKWARDEKLDLIYYFECNSNQWLSSPKNHRISQLKSLLCLRKERLCGLNEFQWLNVFACHSGPKSYLMADTQFMAGPPFSQWQVTFIIGKAFSGGRAKARVLHSWKGKHKHCAWEMKWEKKQLICTPFYSSAQGWLLESASWPPSARLGPHFGRRFCFCFSRKTLISFQSKQASCPGF